MKLLKDILYKAGLQEMIGNTNIAIVAITSDSRKVKKDSLFVAVKGTLSDGHTYIDKAIDLGAAAIICEELPIDLKENIAYIKVNEPSFALGIIANNFYDEPSKKIKLVGITGTNGKTTTATLLYNMFKSLGYKTGLISTIRNMVHNQEIPATHTTPDPVTLNELLSNMLENGCTHAFMEVSSHAVDQNRIAGIEFTGAVFTNITHDHLDYHITFDNYILAKKKFFDHLNSEAFALVNKDDRHGMVMVQNTKAKVRTLSIKSMADFKGRILESHLSGLLLQLNNNEVWTKLIGHFNAYNALAIYAVAMLLGENETNILTTLSNLNSVEGRFQYIKSKKGIVGIVDYAHTPDALENVLKTIKEINEGKGKIITLVGCGGDRDKTKRPIMAKIAASYSDKVILTSDNPRSEDPATIIHEMEVGLEITDKKKAISMVERREAIKLACSMADESDIILVAGKGHEKYQEVNGVKTPFDDLEILSENLKLYDN
jgi:UDP-N-acetylmuramoyl-L-alanyl-D-glutamate--2,6-diaminopimelate ligase